MIRLDSKLLDKIVNTPRYELNLSQPALGYVSGFITGVMDIDPNEENLQKSDTLALALLFIGYEWGKQSMIAEVENMGGEKMKSYSVKYYPKGDKWVIYPIVREDLWVFNKVKEPTETDPAFQIILKSDSVVKAVTFAEQAFFENAPDKLWRKDMGQL